MNKENCNNDGIYDRYIFLDSSLIRMVFNTVYFLGNCLQVSGEIDKILLLGISKETSVSIFIYKILTFTKNRCL